MCGRCDIVCCDGNIVVVVFVVDVVLEVWERFC